MSALKSWMAYGRTDKHVFLNFVQHISVTESFVQIRLMKNIKMKEKAQLVL